MQIEVLSATAFADAQDELANLLRSCVDGGGSLGFLSPLPRSDAIDYWRSLAPQIQSGILAVFVAREESRIVSHLYRSRTAGTAPKC